APRARGAGEIRLADGRTCALSQLRHRHGAAGRGSDAPHDPAVRGICERLACGKALAVGPLRGTRHVRPEARTDAGNSAGDLRRCAASLCRDVLHCTVAPSARPAAGAAALMARLVPFAYGFRPFFLAAGWYALIGIGIWLALYQTGIAPFGSLPAFQWHAHEMLYGFVVAAIAGFMLTAVPSWTGERGFAGRPLIVLATLWLLGR